MLSNRNILRTVEWLKRRTSKLWDSVASSRMAILTMVTGMRLVSHISWQHYHIFYLIVCLLANMSKNNFDFKYVIGRGGFGKVSVHSSKSNLFNALKYGFRSGEWSIVRLSRFLPWRRCQKRELLPKDLLPPWWVKRSYSRSCSIHFLWISTMRFRIEKIST